MATVSLGTLFKIASTTVAEVVSISGPGLDKQMVESTHLNSTNRWREFLSGLRDGGEITLELNFLPADSSQNLVKTNFSSNVTASYTITFTDTAATVWTCVGYCSHIEPSADLDTPLRSNVTIKVTGEPTIV